MYLLYKLAEIHVMPKRIHRLMVVIHHENIHELTSLRFLKLNLECQKIKMGNKTYEHVLFFFHETMF